MEKLTRGNYTFDVLESGPADGEVVVLLHGFPQSSDCWDKVVPLLTAQGYRTVRMNQRGYSPGARPGRRRDYRTRELVADAAALVDACGGRAHVVGHDWGAIVAWGLAMEHPEKLTSLTAVSVGHPMAFMKALVTSPQILRSWYMFFFQLPWVPERVTPLLWDLLLRRLGGLPAESSSRDKGRFAKPADLTGPINWYRAMPLGNLLKEAVGRVAAPTLVIWSDKDLYLGRKQAEASAAYVDGPYRFEVMAGLSHWIPDAAPGPLARLVLDHLGKHPARTATTASAGA